MTDRRKKRVMEEISARLEKKYPDALCALEYGGDPWRLLVMAILSAQCTDARVNAVCEVLFGKFPDAVSLAKGDISEIEDIIKSCGLYHTKSENIKGVLRKKLAYEYGGIIPREMATA